MFKNWLKSEKGATALEYAMIAAGVSVFIMVAVFAFGDALYEIFYSDLPALLDNSDGE